MISCSSLLRPIKVAVSSKSPIQHGVYHAHYGHPPTPSVVCKKVAGRLLAGGLAASTPSASGPPDVPAGGVGGFPRAVTSEYGSAPQPAAKSWIDQLGAPTQRTTLSPFAAPSALATTGGAIPLFSTPTNTWTYSPTLDSGPSYPAVGNLGSLPAITNLAGSPPVTNLGGLTVASMTNVPEPGSALLLTTSIAGLWIVCKLRFRAFRRLRAPRH